MAAGDHSNATKAHRPFYWSVANSAALSALTPASSDDLKLAYQQDTDQVWLLLDYSGPTWLEIGGSGNVSGPGSSTDNTIARANGTGGDIQFSGITIDDSDVLEMADNVLSRPEISDYGVTHNDNGNVSGSVDIDLENGNSQYITVTGNITSMTFSNFPASGVEGSLTLYVEQGGSGSYTIVWPTAVDWPGSSAPTISTAVGSLDLYVFKTLDGGTRVLGAQVGADFG